MATFNDGASALLLGNPFFGCLLLKLRHVADDTIPTLCVGNGEIRYSPKFLDGLSLEVVTWCIAHEVLHAAMGHCERAKHYITLGIGPDGNAFNAGKYNVALDYIVNATLDEVGIGAAWPNALIDTSKYPTTMTPEEVYCLLPVEKAGDKGAMDEHIASDGGLGTADIVQAITASKALGGLPGALERLFGDVVRPKDNPWSVLRQCVTAAVRGRGSSTWKRLHRTLMRRGIAAPSSVAGSVGHVGIVVDVSGSIGDDMLRLFAGHMAAIIDTARPQQVSVIWTDAAVRRVDTVRSGAALNRLLRQPVPGGGGTDMPKGVDHAVSLAVDVCVVLTDGYTGFGERSLLPVVWAITTPGLCAPHGTTVHIAS